MDGTRGALALVAVVTLVAASGCLGGGPGEDATTPAATTPGNTTDVATIPVAYSVDNTTNCGRTCRLMNTTVRNNGTERLRNVSLAIDVASGGEVVWQGTTPVGPLDPGEAASNTTRIDVGLGAGVRIRNNDYDVRVTTTVRAASGQRTFEDDENVR